ncbi:MAG: hypothetical protein KJ645_03865, partial [Planctomycetes bacterium]|nr:hypothetical protein [Planctomycetota bacterium]
MVKRIKSLTVVMWSIFLSCALVACSSLVAPDAPTETSPDVAYGDPILDLAVAIPQEEPAEEPLEQDDMIQEKNEILVDRCLETAQALKEELKYEEAEQQLLEALSLAPANQEVLHALEEVQGLLGKKSGDIGEIQQRAAQRYEVKKQQLKHKA